MLHGPAMDNGVAGRFNLRDRESLFGFYIQNLWRPISWLSLDFGLRIDHIDDLTEHTYISPRIKATIHPSGAPVSLFMSFNRLVAAPPVENHLALSLLPNSRPRPNRSEISGARARPDGGVLFRDEPHGFAHRYLEAVPRRHGVPPSRHRTRRNRSPTTS